MQVINANDVKVYNVSAHKSLPEWISDRKKRQLLKNDVDLLRRIELLQDFSMPTSSTCIHTSRDGQYIIATGIYKPRVRCYDVAQLSMKFERCFDSEGKKIKRCLRLMEEVSISVVRFHILSDDYSKIVFLREDRYVEFHNQNGYYYRIRMPKAGRDMAYHYVQCDLYLAGASSEVYRLNLEQGKFLSSLKTLSDSCNVLELNDYHHLLAVGTIDGRVECWDPRSPKRVGQLSLSSVNMEFLEDMEELPPITALAFRDSLNMAVGTATGQVLLYDIRSSQPYAVRDHNSGLPIRSISFHQELDLVLSADTKMLKIWHRNDCSPYAAVEPESDINQITYIKGTGLLFMATEAPKMLCYYIPSLGPAPKWCSFLDSLVEELEEDKEVTVYDDYKFVTTKDLEALGLTHLLGTDLLRAYMHGYFMDIKLYHKVKSIVEPFAYEEYRKNKIRQKIDEQRATRIRQKKLPKVNRQLAERLLDDQEEKPKDNPLDDDRFKAMFTNPDFQIDEESEEYKFLNPVLAKKAQRKQVTADFEEIKDENDDEIEGRASSEEVSSSDDDGHAVVMPKRAASKPQTAQPKFYQLKRGATYQPPNSTQSNSFRANNYTFEQLLKEQDSQQGTSSSTTVRGRTHGSKEVIVKLKNKVDEEKKREQIKHKTERKKLRRSAHKILPKHKRKMLYPKK